MDENKAKAIQQDIHRVRFNINMAAAQRGWAMPIYSADGRVRFIKRRRLVIAIRRAISENYGGYRYG